MKLLAFFTLLLIATPLSVAQTKESQRLQTESNLIASTIIKVESIQCEMCLWAIEKALKSVKGVTSIEVTLDTKATSVMYLPGQTNVEALETAITKAGYDANKKKADPVAYEKLDDCCKVAEE
ncbi:MAG: heavy metal-associated domain-containing protein [Bacteroidota bacterium]